MALCVGLTDMLEFFDDPKYGPIVWIVIYGTGIAVVCVVTMYGLKRLRESTKDDALPASEVMSKFREVHERGGLSDAEYRTIKSVAGEQLKTKLSDKEETT